MLIDGKNIQSQKWSTVVQRFSTTGTCRPSNIFIKVYDRDLDNKRLRNTDLVNILNLLQTRRLTALLMYRENQYQVSVS